MTQARKEAIEIAKKIKEKKNKPLYEDQKAYKIIQLLKKREEKIKYKKYRNLDQADKLLQA